MTDTEDKRGREAVEKAMIAVRDLAKTSGIDPRSFLMSVAASTVGTLVLNFEVPSILIARVIVDVMCRAEVSSAGGDPDDVDEMIKRSKTYDITH